MLTHQMEQGLIKLSRKTRCWWRGYNQSLEWFICQGTHQKCKVQKLLKTKQFLLLHDGTKCVTNVRKCSVDCWTVASDWTTSSFWFYLQFLTWFYLLQQRVTSSFLSCSCSCSCSLSCSLVILLTTYQLRLISYWLIQVSWSFGWFNHCISFLGFQNKIPNEKQTAKLWFIFKARIKATFKYCNFEFHLSIN